MEILWELECSGFDFHLSDLPQCGVEGHRHVWY